MRLGGKTVTIGRYVQRIRHDPSEYVYHAWLYDHRCGYYQRAAAGSSKSDDVKDTYNMVSVDGDTSTNDTVLLLANGMAGNPEITEKGEDYEDF